jgi:hypothetical protein
MTAQEGYCDVCQRHYANLWQHKQTDRHKQLAAEAEDNNNDDEVEYIEVDNNNDDDKTETKSTTVQIIEGTPEPQKSLAKELMDIALSEQFAPITFSILDAAVKRLQGTHNPEQKRGNITYNQAGQEIEDF